MMAELELLATEDGGLKSSVEEGNRSLIFVFEGLGEEDEKEARFGAVIERIRTGSGQPGRLTEAELWFWIELAAIYATKRATFDVWYAGRIVGHGRILEIAPEW